MLRLLVLKAVGTIDEHDDKDEQDEQRWANAATACSLRRSCRALRAAVDRALEEGVDIIQHERRWPLPDTLRAFAGRCCRHVRFGRGAVSVHEVVQLMPTLLTLGCGVERDDVSPLASLSTLTRLHLPRCNAETDLSALQSLGRLTTLHLQGWEGPPDLSVLASLSTLTELSLSNCTGLTDLSGLGSLDALMNRPQRPKLVHRTNRLVTAKLVARTPPPRPQLLRGADGPVGAGVARVAHQPGPQRVAGT